jgi:dipeptidyl aminopeptidase/acylaminoacyl peptidase
MTTGMEDLPVADVSSSRVRRWLAPALIVVVAGGSAMSWWSTRGRRAAAATERSVEQLGVQVTTRLTQMGAVPLTVSPDRQLAVVGRRLDTGHRLELVRMSDGRLLSNVSVDGPSELTWGPASDVFAFSALQAGKGAVYVWSPTRGSPRAVETWPGSQTATHLTWDAKGERLAFVRPEADQSSRRLIRTLTRDGSGPRTLVATTDVRGLVWTASSPAAQLAAVAPALCRAGIAMIGGRGQNADQDAGAAVRCLSVGQDAQLEHLAHDPRTGRLLVSRRAGGAQFFSLAELDPATGSVRTLAEPDGDVQRPVYTERGYLYHVDRSGQSMLQLAQPGHTSSPFGEGRTRMLSLSADRTTAVVSLASLTRAVQLFEVSLPDGRTRPLVVPGVVDGANRGVRPELLVIDGATAGVQIRDYWWRAPRPSQPRKLVVEVAAQGTSPDPTFRVPRNILLDQGFDVLLAAYRGVTGFGAAFAEVSDPLTQAEDVALSVRHAVERLGYRPADIVVLGAGPAATLAAMAATLAPQQLRRMVLVNPAATTCAAGSIAKVSGRQVTLIHGEGSGRSLAETEFALSALLGSGAVAPPAGRVRPVDNEILKRASPAAARAIAEEVARLLLAAPS